MKRVRRHELRAAAERYLDAASDSHRTSPLAAPLTELITTVDQVVNPIHLLVAQLGEDQTGGLAAARGADLALMVLEVTGPSPSAPSVAADVRAWARDVLGGAIRDGETTLQLVTRIRCHVQSVTYHRELSARLKTMAKRRKTLGESLRRDLRKSADRFRKKAGA